MIRPLHRYLLFSTALFITITSLLMLSSCKKDEPEKVLECSIKSPSHAQRLVKGEVAVIEVDVVGDNIKLDISLDGDVIASLLTPPYQYNLELDEVGSGTHTFMAIATDNTNTAIDSVTAVVVFYDDVVTIDPRDGKEYITVEIGSQTWFAENVNFTTPNSWSPDDVEDNADIYGRLYTWEDALIACPDGWHLPSHDEWKTLEIFLGMTQSQADQTGYRGTGIGTRLKSNSGWYLNGNGIDDIAFMALAAGSRSFDGIYYNFKEEGAWWSASDFSSTTDAWRRGLSYNRTSVASYLSKKDVGHSVRCVKD